MEGHDLLMGTPPQMLLSESLSLEEAACDQQGQECSLNPWDQSSSHSPLFLLREVGL